MIEVQKIEKDRFEVTVSAKQTTTHTVTVSPSYAQKLTGGRCSVEHLIETSFEFLLERELNTSILPSFELPVIDRYFPEYEVTIRRLLQNQ